MGVCGVSNPVPCVLSMVEPNVVMTGMYRILVTRPILLLSAYSLISTDLIIHDCIINPQHMGVRAGLHVCLSLTVLMFEMGINWNEQERNPFKFGSMFLERACITWKPVTSSCGNALKCPCGHVFCKNPN